MTKEEKKKTHVEVSPLWPAEPIKSAYNLFGDSGSVEYWDFSLANTSYESRVHFISKIASVCYQSPKALGSISLFDRLQAEAAGLPSSSYEMCPILLTKAQFAAKDLKACWKFGEQVGDYLLTNLRALIADVGPEESLNYLNTTPEEIQIIKDNFKVFLFNVDLSTRAQMVRHRCSWQELSRRYVSGKKQPFEFYISEKMKGLEHECSNFGRYSTEFIIQTCIDHYNYAIATGVKPEEARRILPQAMMTTIWGAFMPKQLDNYFKLRLHKTAQQEIQDVAKAMHNLISKSK